ncbi:bifunctional fold protein [Plasmopara halstedii]|uniref:Bifunctional fold protein n=1 Tax=Plasmopara halstedii TaxID=4781 RepID=A0A0P1ALR6_PLAHL|nr:bifunctional fold protein [Plasmopara halstedii]CEG41936.1 bifunctional fold protein [Plasmopara halstedii]|eukprot:XP_024578305.1 bifunctional fold protein [Plasmopara halstedii]
MNAMAKLLDGRQCSKEIETELKKVISTLNLKATLVLLLVGTNHDSKTYIRLKKNACIRIGVTPQVHELAESIKFTELSALIQSFNTNKTIHGILLQLPLPDALKSYEDELLESISPFKDVDGLHSHHFARLAEPKTKNNLNQELRLEPCTPAACLEILARNGIELAGKDVTVLGRGRLVGLPLSLMLLAANATVTTCHSKTKNLPDKIRQAEIVFIGTGQPELVKGDWLAKGAVVVDIGINYVDDTSNQKGYRIVGDVNFAAASDRVSAITPVPGGIGPMTIAMLMQNTVKCAKFAASCN